MAAFWSLAVLLGLVAAAFLFIPLWRERNRSGHWSAAGLVAVVVTIPVAVGLYLHVRTYNPALVDHSDQAKLVAELAAKMRTHPDNAQGWLLLGRSYLALGQYPNAEQAFMEAWNHTPKPDAKLKLALGEAMILTDRSQLRGRGADLVEDVLSSEPMNPTALWYGGWAALAQGKNDVARQRWQALLTTNPPQQVVGVVKQQLAALGGTPSGTQQGGAAKAASAARIELKVTVADNVPLKTLGSRARLFIFAQAPGGGPPVAVLREPLESLPGTFVLTDKNAMIPGRTLGAFKELTLVARVSVSGQPLQQSGDYFAEKTYKAGDKDAVDLVINQKVP